MTKIWEHPFKEGIRGIINQHFHPSIAKNFKLYMEGQLYQFKDVLDMTKKQKIVVEVHYQDEGDTAEYLCDLRSWEDKKTTEIKLLRGIGDAVKGQRIGLNWIELPDGRVSEEVRSERNITPIQADEFQDDKKSGDQ